MSNATLVNFAAGETSPRSRGRFDLAWFVASCEKMFNYIAEVPGPAHYRAGFKVVGQTRNGAVARMIPFQLNDSQAYMLEFTTGFMRVYKNEALLTTARTTVTGITQANPAVLTVAATTNLTNGDEVVLAGIVGMEELNGRQVKLTNNVGSTYQLVDPVTGANINSTNFGAWVSGGTVREVYEIASPYLTDDLANIQVAPTNTVMYIACTGYAPYKLSVDDDVFTLATYTRTADPFSVSAEFLDLVDDFASGTLAAWTTSGTVEVSDGSWRGSTFAAPISTAYDRGYAFRSPSDATVGTYVGYIQKAQLIAYGTWQIRAASPISSNCQANPLDTNYLEWRFLMVDASNYYRFKIYGPNAGSFSIVRAIAGVEVTLLTSSISSLRGSTAGRVFTITRSDAGEFVIYDSGVQVATVTDTTHTTSTIMQIRLGTSGDSKAVIDSTNSDKWDAYNYNGAVSLFQTLCWVDDIYVSADSPIETPIAVAFYEGRLGFFGTNQRPNTLFLSRAPDDEGNSRYDDFTGGVDADHACFFTLAPASGQVDFIAWARGTSKHLVVGTFGGPFRVSGGGLDEPITPTSINVRQFDLAGCESVMPAGGNRLFYIQRGGVALRTPRFNVEADDLETYDMCLNAEQVVASPMRRVVLQQGRPDIVWVVREDGVLAGMTVQGAENIAGWHRHKLGGSNTLVLDAQPLPRTDKNDQLWIHSERIINGTTRRFIEIQTDDVVFPDLEDFYSGSVWTPNADDAEDLQGPINLNQRDDLAAFKNATYRRQEEYVLLDAAGTYNGSDRGVAAGATLTPGAITGSGVALTASAAVFRSSDVGNELWKKPDRETGLGSGRAVITAVDGTGTIATCDIVVDFDSLTTIAAGAWHFAVDTIYAPHLDQAVVAVVTDGAVYSDGRGNAGYPTVQVVDSKFTLTEKAAVVHVGFPYDGFIKTHNLEAGGRSGPAQAKPRNIVEMFIRFLYTLGVDYGTDIYKLEKIDHRKGSDIMDRPAPVFSGIKKLPLSDSWEAESEKHVIVAQRLPLPCIVQFIDVRYETADEG